MESDNRAVMTETEGRRSRYGVVNTLPTETVQSFANFSFRYTRSEVFRFKMDWHIAYFDAPIIIMQKFTHFLLVFQLVAGTT